MKISELTRSDILEGIRLIDELDPENLNPSKKYDLLFNNKRYPPKEVLRYANKAIKGPPLKEFTGGDRTNDVLIKLGFSIVLRGTTTEIGVGYSRKKVRVDELDDSFIEEIDNQTYSQTDKEIVTKGRIGQSRFKKKLLNHYDGCAICGITHDYLLIASHIKPWKDSSNKERLDSNNGLLLCPNHDALFDKGYITFHDDGTIQISNKLDQTTISLMNLRDDLKINLTTGQRLYMSWHRENCYVK